MEQHVSSSIADNGFSNSYLIEKKFEVLLDNANKKIMGEILKIRELLNSLQEDVNELRRGSTQAPATVSFPQAERNYSASNESVRPRQNDINPKDVAVEKIFYFGNKR